MTESTPKLILLAIIALGTIASLATWILKRWWSGPEEIYKLKGKADELKSSLTLTSFT